ncbi:MAG: 3-keto-5-aminohexanoate cleavage protein [Paracoccaceae bacterium]
MSAIMVAPNGARKGKSSHPEIPTSIDEITATAIACHKAGADAMHLHVRNPQGRPSLDAGLYREAIAHINDAMPGRFPVQISTETFGDHDAEDVINLLDALRPEFASVSMRDLTGGGMDRANMRRLLFWAKEAGVSLQHLLYSPDEFEALLTLLPRDDPAAFLFVLGGHRQGAAGDPAELLAFLKILSDSNLRDAAQWMVCGFSRSETACVVLAAILGGHCRVGFENNLQHPSGAIASDNAERVRAVRKFLDDLSSPKISEFELGRVLGKPDD